MENFALWEHVCGVISEMTDGHFDKYNIERSAKMVDLGLDSLKYARLMLSLEEVTGISLNEDNINWYELDTLGKLLELYEINN